MEKGYYKFNIVYETYTNGVAIHNKNGKGLLRKYSEVLFHKPPSQSTIKMEKGYYKK